MDRKTVIETARSWIGTPYKHQGRDRHGVDCIGFIWGVGKELGYAPIIPTNYPRTANPAMLMEYVNKFLVSTPRKIVKELKLADIVLLQGIDREPQHFCFAGTYSFQPTMLHAFIKVGKVTEHSWDRFWSGRIVGVYEFPDLV